MVQLLKAIVREGLKAALPSRQPAIVVASMGRSGSTLVYMSLVEAMATKRFGKWARRLTGLVRDSAWVLDGCRFRSGRIYKTHDFPYSLSPRNPPRVVFLFGSASDAARSVIHCEKVYGRAWIDEHFQHLSANGEFEEINEKDVLRFGEQLEAWLSCETAPILALRYEDLWTSGAETLLSQFAGFPVRFPARKARQSANVNLGAGEAQLDAVYAELDTRIAMLPPIIANSKARTLLAKTAAGQDG